MSQVLHCSSLLLDDNFHFFVELNSQFLFLQRVCRERCLTDQEGQDEQEDHQGRPTVCGWCRFSEWLGSQGLPTHLEAYCKHVLHFLAMHDDQFLDVAAILGLFI